MRKISRKTIAALQNDSFNIATLVALNFDPVIRITDWGRDVTVLRKTWKSSGHILSVGDVTESSEIRVNDLSLTLSGVEQSYVQLFLSTPSIDIPVTIYRAVFAEGDRIIGEPIVVFDGLITSFSIDDSGEKSVVEVEIASHWKDFEKENGRKTNHNSQQIHFLGDKGFEYAAKSITGIKWGRK